MQLQAMGCDRMRWHTTGCERAAWHKKNVSGGFLFDAYLTVRKGITHNLKPRDFYTVREAQPT